MSVAIPTYDGVRAEPTASVRVVRALAETVILAGVTRDELLRRAGLIETQLDDPNARLRYSEVWRICELAMELTGDPALGLHWAETHAAHSFIPVAHLVMHAASLRAGLASLTQFERLLSDEPNFRLLEQDEHVTLRCTPALRGASASMRRFAADMMLASFFRIFRSFNPLARPVLIAVEHAAPAYAAEYGRILGQPVLFAQPHTELTFERTVLDAPSPARDQDVHDMLQTLAQDRITRLTQGPSYALRIRDYLIKEGYHQRCDMQHVARRLGLSVRSLRRRLDVEGKSYLDVEGEALATVARHFLRERQLSIQETAYAMGFSNTTTFHRAFKRWTGTTPNAYKRRKD